MATIVLTVEQQCPANTHLRIKIDLDGVTRRREWLYVPSLMTPLDEEEILSFCKLVIRIYNIGRTPAQVRTALQSGLTVTI